MGEPGAGAAGVAGVAAYVAGLRRTLSAKGVLAGLNIVLPAAAGVVLAAAGLQCVVRAAEVPGAAALHSAATMHSAADDPASVAAPLTTAEHLRSSAWWPTRSADDLHAYAGSQSCAKCHTGIAETQATSQMAHTLSHGGRSTVLPTVAGKPWSLGRFVYTVLPGADGGWTMHVKDGAAVREAQLEWSFGSGEVGQSYLWQSDRRYVESRFNYFAHLGGFAPTPGRLHGAPLDLAMAAGRPVEPFEARTCFACHTTALPASEPLQPAAQGVSCEACHGPGARHVEAMQQADGRDVPRAELHIVNGARMSPAAAVDMCGSCHSTPLDVRLMGAAGAQTVRFPAYRLEKSRCWGAAGDARLTCTACHDPHAPLQKADTGYDHACLQCHGGRPAQTAQTSQTAQAAQAAQAKLTAASLQVGGSAHTAPAAGARCPVATSKCVSCHMPKVDLPEMHYAFTDHNIRIVRKGAGFPD